MEKAKETETKVVAPTELVRDESDTLKMSFFKNKSLTKNNIDDQLDRPKSSKTDAESLSNDNLDFKLPQEPPVNSKTLFQVPKCPIPSSSRLLDDSSSSSSNSSSVFKVPEEKKDDKRKLSALDEIITMEEKKREKVNRKDYWLHKVIIYFNKNLTSNYGTVKENKLNFIFKEYNC